MYFFVRRWFSYFWTIRGGAHAGIHLSLRITTWIPDDWSSSDITLLLFQRNPAREIVLKFDRKCPGSKRRMHRPHSNWLRAAIVYTTNVNVHYRERMGATGLKVHANIHTHARCTRGNWNLALRVQCWRRQLLPSDARQCNVGCSSTTLDPRPTQRPTKRPTVLHPGHPLH